MLETAFARRYPLETEGHLTLRKRGIALCRRHLENGLGDNDAERRLCSPIDEIYWQQLSEVLVADQLAQVGLLPSHRVAGPDFLIEYGQRRIWIEVICPTPVGIPAEWFVHADFEAYSMPHEAMLLRWHRRGGCPAHLDPAERSGFRPRSDDRGDRARTG
jgi:hypothetical protein